MTLWLIYGFKLKGDEEFRYIGYTTKGIEGRLRSHTDSLRSRRLPLYDWINHHGLSNVEIVEVQECVEGDFESINKAERYWIRHYRSLGHRLLNCDDGGIGGRGRIVSTETRIKLSELRTGKPSTMSEDARSRASTRMRENNPSNHSEEWKENHSKAMSGKSNPMYGRTGELAPAFGRVGEFHPLFGKPSPQKGKTRPKIKCPHCPKEGGAGSMHRWHFDNCKTKKDIEN